MLVAGCTRYRLALARRTKVCKNAVKAGGGVKKERKSNRHLCTIKSCVHFMRTSALRKRAWLGRYRPVHGLHTENVVALQRSFVSYSFYHF